MGQIKDDHRVSSLNEAKAKGREEWREQTKRAALQRTRLPLWLQQDRSSFLSCVTVRKRRLYLRPGVQQGPRSSSLFSGLKMVHPHLCIRATEQENRGSSGKIALDWSYFPSHPTELSHNTYVDFDMGHLSESGQKRTGNVGLELKSLQGERSGFLLNLSSLIYSSLTTCLQMGLQAPCESQLWRFLGCSHNAFLASRGSGGN